MCQGAGWGRPRPPPLSRYPRGGRTASRGPVSRCSAFRPLLLLRLLLSLAVVVLRLLMLLLMLLLLLLLLQSPMLDSN